MACPSCFTGSASTSTPTGTTQQLHGYNTYIASPSPDNPIKSTIILYTDAFGHHLPNTLLLADALASATHCTVLIPDIIPGGGCSPAVLPLMDTFTSPSSSYLSKTWALVRAAMHLVPFFWRASPASSACTGPCIAYARAVKGELGPAGKMGIVGYCWGGYQALHVAGTQGEGVVDAVFVAHPARFQIEHAVEARRKGVGVSFAHAGEDMSLEMGKVEETQRQLQGDPGFEVRVYEGCGHGFAVRAKPGDGREETAMEEALGQAVEWFGKWL